MDTSKQKRNVARYRPRMMSANATPLGFASSAISSSTKVEGGPLLGVLVFCCSSLPDGVFSLGPCRCKSRDSATSGPRGADMVDEVESDSDEDELGEEGRNESAITEI